MHSIIVLLYCIIFWYIIKDIKNFPYALMVFFVMGCMGSALGIDVSFVTIAGITTNVSDVLLLILIFHTLAYRNKKFSKKSFYLLLSAYVALLLVSMILGLMKVGISATVIANFRKYIEYTIPWLLLSCNADCLNLDFARLKRWADICVYIVLAFCLIGWLQYFAGMRQSLRVIQSAGALMLSLYALYNMYEALIVEKEKMINLKSIAAFIAVFILQHNSVWAATAAGIIIILTIDVIRNKKNAVPVILFFCGCFLLAVFILSSASDNMLMEAIVKSMSKFEDMDAGTIGHRRRRWSYMLGHLTGMARYVGLDFSVAVSAGDGTQFSAHSAYVAAVMHSGFIGACAFVGALISMAACAIRKKKYLILTFLVTMMVYWYAYEPDVNEAVILGIMAYMCFSRKREPDDYRQSLHINCEEV